MKQLFLILLLITVSLPQSKACSCIGKETVKDAVKNAQSIVVGKIVAREKLYLFKASKTEYKSELDSIYRSKYFQYSFAVEVITVYKGKKRKDTINIVTGAGSGDCGYNFEIGNLYIIYAKKTIYKMKKKRLGTYMVTNICSRTCLLNDEEIAAIEQYRKAKKR